jgi:hypothetical protein
MRNITQNCLHAHTTGATASCDAPEHVAISGISIQSWEGGSMPENEDMVYWHRKTISGFTVLAFTILTFALTWGVASALSGVVGAASSSVSALTAASIGAGVYAGTAALNGAGLTTAQSGWMGSTGNGVLKVNTTSMDKHQIGLLTGVEAKQIKSRVGTGLTGAVALYSGNCAETWTVKQCQTAGKDPGTMHRPDSYSETNTTVILADQKTYCDSQVSPADKLLAQTDPVMRETIRKWVQQCASPTGGSWATGW